MKEHNRFPLTLVSVDPWELLVGLWLIVGSFLIPLLLNVHSFDITLILLRALRHSEKIDLIDAAIRLVALNTLRSIPHYVGAYFVGESLSFRWREEHRAWYLNAALILVILLTTYRGIEAIHNIHYDFGLPAMLVSFFVFFFRKLHYRYISMAKKAMLIMLALSALQFLDVMPIMDSFPVGRGETSMDIKLAASILGAEGVLNTVGTVGMALFLAFTIALFFQLRDENNLKQLSLLREQNQLITTQAQLNEMKNRTHQEMQYLVHDLKSPLTTVQSLVGVLKMQCEAEERTKEVEYLDYVENAVERMSRMISEILYEDQRSPITTQELVSVAMSQSSVADYAPFLHLDNQLPQAVVSANRFLFPRALVNLLQNSAQAVSSDRELDIWLRVHPGVQPDTIAFTVEDNGVGISQEQLDSIWNRGVSGNQSSGLGLAFVRNVVENMEGHIRVETRLNAGTKISLELPEETPT